MGEPCTNRKPFSRLGILFATLQAALQSEVCSPETANPSRPLLRRDIAAFFIGGDLILMTGLGAVDLANGGAQLGKKSNDCESQVRDEGPPARPACLESMRGLWG